MTITEILTILNIYVKNIHNEFTIVLSKLLDKYLFIYYYSANYITYCIITFIFVKQL
jgi:hypothetical protein